tara:strand:+ start:515 stop:733 length:219 start_codon:yes stop_codon:yes gene_type:complete
MDSEKKSKITELSLALSELCKKVESLKTKLDRLCKETGACGNITKANKDLLRKSAQKEIIDGTNINALCEKK